MIARYSPEGIPECKGRFSGAGDGQFNAEKQFRFTYLSHCNKVTIIQDNKIYEFFRGT